MAASLSLARSTCLTRHISRGVSLSISSLFITPSCSPCTKVPALNYATTVQLGSGGKHWKYERIISIALVGLIPTGLIYPNPVVDYGLAIIVPIHAHWGLESVLEDYVPQSMKKLAYPLLYCISLLTFAGLMFLNYADVGICKAVKTIWSSK